MDLLYIYIKNITCFTQNEKFNHFGFELSSLLYSKGSYRGLFGMLRMDENWLGMIFNTLH